MFTARLDASNRPALLAHFLALNREDRRMRFGFIARDTSVERYVKDIDFEQDAVFGVQSGETGRQFDGIAHLAFARHHVEIGVSVLEQARGQGIGSALVSRAVVHARNLGIEKLFMHGLSENDVVMRIARSLGISVVTIGCDSEASLAFPATGARSALRETAANAITLYDAELRLEMSPPASRARNQLQAIREERPIFV